MLVKTRQSVIGIIPQYPAHSQHNIYAKIRMPPVGIISILTEAKLRGYSAYGIDENNYGGPLDHQGMPDHGFLHRQNPASIALLYGGMSNSVPRLFRLAGAYRRFGCLTIAGGSHVDALPEEALRNGVDIVVHGEGEETIREILDAHAAGDVGPSRLRSIRGISFLDRGAMVKTGPRHPVHDLDTFLDPDPTLIKYLEKRWSLIPISRSRGCNFNCEFCVVNTQYGRFKHCSPEKTLNQIITYADLGYRTFFITDDNFAQDPKDTIALCRMIGDYTRRFKKKLHLNAQVRSEAAEDDGLIEAMRYAGVVTLAIGYESPIDSELKAMRKGVTVDLLVRRSRKLANHFYLHGMFIFGYPSLSESKRSPLSLRERAKEYIRFFRKARIDTVQVLNAVPLPGSELRRRLDSAGRLLPLSLVGWDKYDGSFLCYDPTSEGLDPHELQELPRMLMKRRYLGRAWLRHVNFGNWMNWAFIASVGFPFQFGVFYTKRFISEVREGRKRRAILNGKSLLPRRTLAHEALVRAWRDICRQWRNLAVKTYAGGIVRKWVKEYKKSGYRHTLKNYLVQKQ